MYGIWGEGIVDSTVDFSTHLGLTRSSICLIHGLGDLALSGVLSYQDMSVSSPPEVYFSFRECFAP